MAKISEPLGLSVHLKGKLGIWKGVIAQKKEISEDLRKTVANAHVAGKSYKIISAEFWLHHSTIRQVIYKGRQFCYPPQKWMTSLQQWVWYAVFSIGKEHWIRYTCNLSTPSLSLNVFTWSILWIHLLISMAYGYNIYLLLYSEITIGWRFMVTDLLVGNMNV